MTTNVILGFSFGILTIILHIYVLYTDHKLRKTHLYYSYALFIWVIGNFLWMSTEFISTKPSSSALIPSNSTILGPRPPLNWFSDETIDIIIFVKNILMYIAAIIQFTMYFLIFFNKIPSPVDEDDAKILRKKLFSYDVYINHLKFFRKKKSKKNKLLKNNIINNNKQFSNSISDVENNSSGIELVKLNKNNKDEKALSEEEFLLQSTPTSDFITDTDTSSAISKITAPISQNSPTSSSESPSSLVTVVSPFHSPASQSLSSLSTYLKPPKKINNILTLTMIEHVYIIFWILKDIFWSWGTGELFNITDFNTNFFFELIGILCSGCGFVIYFYYIILFYNEKDRFVDFLTMFCWLSANFTWMTGEFFIRYETMNLDDETEGNDDVTRIISFTFFLFGIFLQFIQFLMHILYYYTKEYYYTNEVYEEECGPGDEENDSKKQITNPLYSSSYFEDDITDDNEDESEDDDEIEIDEDENQGQNSCITVINNFCAFFCEPRNRHQYHSLFDKNNPHSQQENDEDDDDEITVLF